MSFRLLALSVSLVSLPERDFRNLTGDGDGDGGGNGPVNVTRTGDEEGRSYSYNDSDCHAEFVKYVLFFIVLWAVALLTEVFIAAVALRGTIFNDQERRAAEYLLYVKLGESVELSGSGFGKGCLMTGFVET